MSKTSKQLWAMRKALVESMDAAAAEGNNEELLRLEGEIRAMDARIEDVVEYEDRIRNAPPANSVASENMTIAEQLFGPRAEFNGIAEGFTGRFTMQDAATELPVPQIHRTDLPAPIEQPNGFLDTIMHGTTDGAEHYFQQPNFTNNAAAWTDGNKPESAIAWPEAVANLETIAHWIPILKQTAKRYTQLDSVTRGALLMGLALKSDMYAIRAANSSGMVGIVNTPGIIQHGKAAGKTLQDTVRTMKRKARVASGIEPDYVCLTPYALECMCQEKDDDGHYLDKEIERTGMVAGLQIVEDMFMQEVKTSGETGNETTTFKEQMLVYWGGAASFNVADPQEVTVGLTGNQLIQNAYTLLAEVTATLRVDMPSAFCFCPDLGIAAEA